jgi:DNA-binding NtrC family response regulator
MVPQRIASPRSDATTSQHSVLIVDDDEATCRLLADWTRSLGYGVDVTFGADAALKILRRGTAQVALCDICMPGHDGIWLIDQIARHCPAVAVVIVTGLTKMEPAVTLRPGVTAYITKPFRFEDVATAIGGAFKAIASNSGCALR